jgi:hypothetical protein
MYYLVIVWTYSVFLNLLHLIEISDYFNDTTALPPGKSSCIQWAGGWLDPRAGPHTVAKRVITASDGI